MQNSILWIGRSGCSWCSIFCYPFYFPFCCDNNAPWAVCFSPRYPWCCFTLQRRANRGVRARCGQQNHDPHHKFTGEWHCCSTKVLDCPQEAPKASQTDGPLLQLSFVTQSSDLSTPTGLEWDSSLCIVCEHRVCKPNWSTPLLQILANPRHQFNSSSIYKNVTLVAWDPAPYTVNLHKVGVLLFHTSCFSYTHTFMNTSSSSHVA